MNFKYKKLAAGIAAGAMLLSSMTTAAFADTNHSSLPEYTSSHNAEQPDQWGFHSHRLFTTLNGEEEVPGPGDPNGFGFTRVKVDHEKGEVCVNIRAFNISTATAAHIHHAEMGKAGPIVVPLPTPDSRGRSAGCVTVSTDLAEDLVDHPSEFYVNVHSTEYSDGAIRGQL